MKKNLNFFILLAFVLLMAAPLKAEEAKEANDLEDESQFEDIEDTSLDIQGRSLRGNLWEYDKGPEKNSDFLKIFTSLPNYRAIGRSVIGEERYRWHWGPVFYRGRLGENEVKILVIGQEGAQDEALARHTFTGGTGTHMQALLNFLGVNRSYLFVNTFIYSIRGQYQDKKLPGAIEGDLWMAQDLQSPIVQTRHRLLNEILKRNQESLKVIVAVGGGAKDTLQTWIKSKGGVCRQAGVVESCDSSVLKEDLVVMGVAHPGMSGQAKNDAERKQILDMLRGSFQKASNRVATKLSQNSEWLPLDEEAWRSPVVERQAEDGETYATFEKSYKYHSSPIPHRDFAFGTNARLGSGGTVSNRTTDQRSIKIFSAKGHYNEKVRWHTPDGSSFKDSGYIDEEGDLPYEPPRNNPNAYDQGPGEAWARLLMGQEKGFEWPDFNELGVTFDKSFGTGPIFKVGPFKPFFLILADQESQDDMFTTRVLSGDGGQKLQHLLLKAGITRSYVIIRTLPVDTLDLSEREVRRVSGHDQVQKVRNKILSELLSQNDVKVILTVGPLAQEALEKFKTKNLPVFHLKSVKDPDAAQNWTEVLKRLSNVDYEKDEKADFKFSYNKREFKNTRLQINRHDLPFGTPRWMGTSGSLASRAQDDTELYQMTMPLWAAKLRAPKLSREEFQSLKDGGWTK